MEDKVMNISEPPNSGGKFAVLNDQTESLQQFTVTLWDDNNNLKKENNDLRDQMQSLLSRLQSAKKTKKQTVYSEEQQELLKDENLGDATYSRSEVQDMKDQIKTGKDAKDQAEQALVEARTEQGRLEGENEMLTNRVERLATDNAEMKKQTGELQERLDEVQAQSKTLETANASTGQERDSMNRQVQELLNQVRELTQANERQVRELTEANDNLKEEKRRAEESHKDQMGAVTEEKNKLQQSLADVTRARDGLTKEVDDLIQTQAEKNNQIQSLTDNVNTLKDEKAESEAQREAAVGEKKALERAKEAVETRANTLMTERNELTQKMENVEELLKAEQTVRRKLEASDTTNTDLARQLSRLIEEKQAETDKLADQYEKKLAEKEAWLEKQFDQHIQYWEDQQKRELKQRWNEALLNAKQSKDIADKTRDENEKLRRENSQLQPRLRDLQVKYKTLELEKQQQDAELSFMNSTVDDANRERDMWKAKSKDQLREISRLKSVATENAKQKDRYEQIHNGFTEPSKPGFTNRFEDTEKPPVGKHTKSFSPISDKTPRTGRNQPRVNRPTLTPSSPARSGSRGYFPIKIVRTSSGTYVKIHNDHGKTSLEGFKVKVDLNGSVFRTFTLSNIILGRGSTAFFVPEGTDTTTNSWNSRRNNIIPCPSLEVGPGKVKLTILTPNSQESWDTFTVNLQDPINFPNMDDCGKRTLD